MVVLGVACGGKLTGAAANFGRIHVSCRKAISTIPNSWATWDAIECWRVMQSMLQPWSAAFAAEFAHHDTIRWFQLSIIESKVHCQPVWICWQMLHRIRHHIQTSGGLDLSLSRHERIILAGICKLFTQQDDGCASDGIATIQLNCCYAIQPGLAIY